MREKNPAASRRLLKEFELKKIEKKFVV